MIRLSPPAVAEAVVGALIAVGSVWLWCRLLGVGRG